MAGVVTASDAVTALWQVLLLPLTLLLRCGCVVMAPDAAVVLRKVLLLLLMLCLVVAGVVTASEAFTTLWLCCYGT